MCARVTRNFVHRCADDRFARKTKLVRALQNTLSMHIKTSSVLALLALCACGTSPDYTVRDQWDNSLSQYLPGTSIELSIWEQIESDAITFSDRFRPTMREFELSSSDPSVLEIVEGRAVARAPGDAELTVVVDDAELVRAVRVQEAAEIRLVDDSWFRNSGIFTEPMGGRILAFARGRVDVHARYFDAEGNRIYTDHVLAVESEVAIDAPEGTPQGNVVRALLEGDDAQLTFRVPGASRTIDIETVDTSEITLSLQHLSGAGHAYDMDEADVVFVGGTVEGVPVRGVAPHARWDADGITAGVGSVFVFQPARGATRLHVTVGEATAELELPLDIQEATLIP